jgi:hypothetical protein
VTTTTPGPPPRTSAGRDLVACADCGLRADPSGAACPRCGADLPRPGAVWREGRTLVALRDAVLPDRCVRCGEPGDGEPIRRRLYWHHPAIYLLLLFWVIPYIVVALAVRRTSTLTMSVCARHRRIRRRALWAAWALLGAAIVDAVAAIALGSAALGVLVPVLVLAALVAGIGGRSLLLGGRIDERIVRAHGAGRGFLRGVADWSDPAGAPGPTPPAAAPATPATAVSSSADVGDILARVWPELRSDPARSAEFEWALDGLHPGVIEGVADSFAREARPLPPAALLRTAVLARTRAGAARYSAPAPRPPAWAPAIVARLSSRRRVGVAALVGGLAACIALGATEQPWARVSADGRALELSGEHVAGGSFAGLAGLAGIITAVVLAVLIVRRSALGRLRAGFGVAAVAHALGGIGALTGLGDVSSSGDDLALAGARVDPAWGLWTALAAAATGLVAALYGYLTVQRRQDAA